MLAGSSSTDGAPSVFLEGHLKIISPKEVELADETPSKGIDVDYAESPLIISSQDGKKEVARVTADENGKYRAALPPGDYILDVQGRQPKGHLRETATLYSSLKSDPARGHEHRHGRPLTFVTAGLFRAACMRFP